MLPLLALVQRMQVVERLPEQRPVPVVEQPREAAVVEQAQEHPAEHQPRHSRPLHHRPSVAELHRPPQAQLQRVAEAVVEVGAVRLVRFSPRLDRKAAGIH
jgi:hypothetical protein